MQLKLLPLVALLLGSFTAWANGAKAVDEIVPEVDLDISRPYTNRPISKKYCDIWFELELSPSADPTAANVTVHDRKGDDIDEQKAKQTFAEALTKDNFAHPNLLFVVRIKNDEIWLYEGNYYEGCKWPKPAQPENVGSSSDSN